MQLYSLKIEQRFKYHLTPYVMGQLLLYIGNNNINLNYSELFLFIFADFVYNCACASCIVLK